MAGSVVVRRTIGLVVIVALLLVTPRALSAQGSGWDVRRDPFAELWFHGLALTAARGYGPLPLYSATYARDAQVARARRAVPTRLDAALPMLRRAMARDSALEVLHFVPLHFVGEEPGAVLHALREAVGPSAPRFAPPRLASRAAAVAAALPTRAQRETLMLLLDALDDEWRRFVRDDRSTRFPDDVALVALQRTWDTSFATPLERYLRAVGRTRGVVIVVPALGAEGRIVTAAGTAVVAVAADHGDEPNAPLLAAVRELAYPLLDQLPDATLASAPADRVAAAFTREIAAVRAGALLLDAVAPAHASAYRRLFVGARGADAGTLEQSYPLDGDVESALRQAVSRLGGHSPIGQPAARRR